MIAPCVNILRDLGRNFKQMLGTDLGTAHHPMDLSVDLPDLMESLDDHEVYIFKKGRYLDDDDLPVADIISVGFDNLISTKASPLNDYNKAFLSLQARRRLHPLFPPAVPCSDSTQLPESATTTIVISETAVPTPIPPSENLQSNNELDTDSENSSDEEETDIFELEDLGEYLYSFEDESFEPSLALATPADVSLDMDAEDLGDDGDELSDDDINSDTEHGGADSISEDDVECLDSNDEHD